MPGISGKRRIESGGIMHAKRVHILDCDLGALTVLLIGISAVSLLAFSLLKAPARLSRASGHDPSRPCNQSLGRYSYVQSDVTASWRAQRWRWSLPPRLATWPRVTSPPWPRPRPSRLSRSSPRRPPRRRTPHRQASRRRSPTACGDRTEPAPSAEPAAATEQQTAIEPAVAPDPLASLDPADRAVAENIRDLLATRGDKLFAGKKERAAVEAFYQNRNFAPLWLDKGVENARAEAVIARMKNADADGLEPGDYKAPSFAGLAPDALAEAELRLTRAVLTYARHVQAGRFPYTRVSRTSSCRRRRPSRRTC